MVSACKSNKLTFYTSECLDCTEYFERLNLTIPRLERVVNRIYLLLPLLPKINPLSERLVVLEEALSQLKSIDINYKLVTGEEKKINHTRR